MTIEIKFRAWDQVRKEMLRPENVLLLPKRDGGGQAVSGAGHNYALMQFTGLHDKNGKEVFEGDIVEIYEHESESKIDRRVYEVIWGGTDYPAFDLDGWDGETNALAEIEQSGAW